MIAPSVVRLEERRAYAEERLAAFAGRLRDIPILANHSSVCVFACGSFGRLEAYPGSDLDVYIVEDQTHPSGPLAAEDQLRILAAVSAAATELEFTRMEGGYAQLHTLLSAAAPLALVRACDGRYPVHWTDRARVNSFFFSARLLLLLEGRAVFGDVTARRAQQALLYEYAALDRDPDGLPRGLLDDILRFWHKMVREAYRHRADAEPDTVLHELKLHVSRRLLCFATIGWLAAADAPALDARAALLDLTPLDRLRDAARRSAAQAAYEDLADLYTRFLEIAQTPDALVSLGDPDRRRRAFELARVFASRLRALLHAIDERGRARQYTDARIPMRRLRKPVALPGARGRSLDQAGILW